MGPVLVRLSSIITMRAFVLVVLSLAAVHADSDAYTIGQVATGHTNGGVVTGVDYGHGLVSGVGALGNRAAVYAGHLGYAEVLFIIYIMIDLLTQNLQTH